MEKLTMTEPDFVALSRAMRKVDFFAPLALGDIEQIVKFILLYRYKAGERVFRQGDVGDAFYIVYDGEVSVRLKRYIFFEKVLARLGPGDFIGATALLSSEPRNAGVVCEKPTRLFVLLSADFAYIIKKNPAFAAEMRKMMERQKFMKK